MANKNKRTIPNLFKYGKENPDKVKTWGGAAVAGVVGVVGATAVTKGLLTVASTLANPFFVLPVGALGGGILGWHYMNSRTTVAKSNEDNNS